MRTPLNIAISNSLNKKNEEPRPGTYFTNNLLGGEILTA